MLRKGQTFTLNGHPWRVAYVTPCRAHCVSTRRTVVTIPARGRTPARTFTAPVRQTLDISPDSPLDLLSDTSFMQGRAS